MFEPFFTTKEVGKGIGPRPEHGLRLRQAVGRPHPDLQRGRPRHHDQALSAAGAAAQVEAAPAAATPLPRGNETILVVEDDALVRNFVIVQLQSLGYRTIAAANGPAALSLIDDGEAFDLLFTDVIMPGGMTGRELAEKVAKLPARHQGALHVRLYRQRHRASGPARSRRAAADQAVSQAPSSRR